MKKRSTENHLNINLISTYDEVNLGDDLLLYAALAEYKGIVGTNVTVNGRELNDVFVKRTAKKSKTHFLRLRFFRQNIYYGGTNFIFKNQVANLVDSLRVLYYTLLSIFFRLNIVANGIATFPKMLRFYYGLCKSISVRDLESRAFLTRYGLVVNLKEDPVITLFNSRDKIFTDNGKLEGVEGVLILRGRYMEFPYYNESIGTLLSKTSPHRISHIIFFQQGEVPNAATQFEGVNTLIYDGSWTSMQLIIKIIRSSSFVFSMRLHGLLLAKLYGIKATPIVIDDKLDRTYVGL